MPRGVALTHATKLQVWNTFHAVLHERAEAKRTGETLPWVGKSAKRTALLCAVSERCVVQIVNEGRKTGGRFSLVSGKKKKRKSPWDEALRFGIAQMEDEPGGPTPKKLGAFLANCGFQVSDRTLARALSNWRKDLIKNSGRAVAANGKGVMIAGQRVFTANEALKAWADEARRKADIEAGGAAQELVVGGPGSLQELHQEIAAAVACGSDNFEGGPPAIDREARIDAAVNASLLEIPPRKQQSPDSMSHDSNSDDDDDDDDEESAAQNRARANEAGPEHQPGSILDAEATAQAARDAARASSSMSWEQIILQHQ